MALIVKQDTDGVKGLLNVGELGLDNYPAGGDQGRVYVGTGSGNIALAIKYEVDAKVDKDVGKGLSTEDYTTAEKVSVDINTALTTIADTLPKAINELNEVKSETVSAINQLNSSVATLKEVTGTITASRYDKLLSTLDIDNMVYSNGSLVTVVYDGDDGSTVYYRDVLEYLNGNLVKVDHYYGTADLVAQSATSTLTYDVNDNLVTTTYTE